MSNIIKAGYISIGNLKLYVEPENYSTFIVGNKTEILPTSKGFFIKTGYGRQGFRISTNVFDASLIDDLESVAINALKSGSPITATDTLHPGGKTWSGFIDLPIVTTGTAHNTGISYLPQKMTFGNIEISFTNTKFEPL